MRKRIICAIVAALAIVGLTALPASAHIRPALLGMHIADCDSHKGTYNTDGLTFYSANITWAGNNDSCWTTFRGIAKCKVGHSQTNTRVNGPWEDISNPGSQWSRANCPNGDNLYQGGVQGSHTGDGTLSPVFWTWPSSGHAFLRVSKRCVVNYDWRANAPAGVTAVDLETNTCNDTIQDRTQCRSITSGAVYYTYSGETNGLEVNEGATCAPFDTAVAGAIQYPDGQTWHTYWVV